MLMDRQPLFVCLCFVQSFSDGATMRDAARSHCITARVLTGAVSCLCFRSTRLSRCQHRTETLRAGRWYSPSLIEPSPNTRLSANTPRDHDALLRRTTALSCRQPHSLQTPRLFYFLFIYLVIETYIVHIQTTLYRQRHVLK